VVVLIGLAFGVGAQEPDPVEPTPTPAPAVEEGPILENPDPSSDPESGPSDPDGAEAPGPGADDESATETEAPKEVPQDPEEQFDLNPYPETAKKKPIEKWHTFVDGARGLLVWDFFDGKLTIRAHARLQIDGTLADSDDRMQSFYGEFDDSIELRRFQAFAQGTIDHHLRYSLSFNFGADPGFGDIFVEGREHGLNVFGYRVGQFRLGSFQEPFSFERMMSSYYTGFAERALPVWAFTPGNNLGYMVFDTTKNKRLSWAVGFFSLGQTNEENSSNSVLSLTTRVTWLPLYRDEGRKLFHIGGSFSNRDPQGSATRYRSRPEARFVNFLVDTGDFTAGSNRLYGIEAVGVSGPLSIQSEFIASEVDGTEWGKLSFWGSYVQVGWFLTGEHHSYDHEMGVFSRIEPKTKSEGLFRRRQGGAIELVGRLSNVDLDDGGIAGGKMTNVSFGVNWYLNATSAMKLSYIHTNVEDRGRGNIFVLRYQFRPLPVPGWR
jgi:phosphate-selective porin OprO/OprP